MFSRFVTLLPLAVVATVVAAAPNALEARNGACTTGNEYCCNQAFSNPATFTGILGGLLSVLADTTANVGLACDPVTVIGAGSGGACSVQTACCDGNPVNGVVNIVCTPISVNV